MEPKSSTKCPTVTISLHLSHEKCQSPHQQQQRHTKPILLCAIQVHTTNAHCQDPQHTVLVPAKYQNDRICKSSLLPAPDISSTKQLLTQEMRCKRSADVKALHLDDHPKQKAILATPASPSANYQLFNCTLAHFLFWLSENCRIFELSDILPEEPRAIDIAAEPHPDNVSSLATDSAHRST